MSDQASNEVKESKSIVPARYAGRYKDGGSDELAKYINEQCKTSEGFDYDKFFQLALANGVPQEQIDKYRPQIEEKRHGAQGRTRMTLRNMIATNVRKTGKVTGVDGSEVDIHLEKPQLSGAAAKAKSAGNGTEEGVASDF